MSTEIIAAIIVGVAGIIATVITLIAQRNKNKIKMQNAVILKQWSNSPDISPLFTQAQSVIYICTHSAFGWSAYLGILLAQPNIKLNLLVADSNNENLIKAYGAVKNRDFHPIDETIFKRLREHPNIEIRVIDSLMPTTFIARDVDTNDGYIRAFHNFNDTDDAVFLDFAKDDNWYQIYHRQLKIIWERGELFFINSK